MIHIAFCDDNLQFLCLLRDLVEKECTKRLYKKDSYSIGPALGSGEDVLAYISSHPIDILFLDIDMPGMNGFDVARRLCSEYPQIKIVFVSAYDNFVYSSFEYFPVAYLRKAHIAEELPKVLNRIVSSLCASQLKITLATSVGEKKVALKNITYVESNRNYCVVHVLPSKSYLCRCTLTSFEDQFPKTDFFRIHSAFLVNLEHVERILNNEEVLVNDVTLPLAQRRVQKFKKVYMDYVRRHMDI